MSAHDGQHVRRERRVTRGAAGWRACLSVSSLGRPVYTVQLSASQVCTIASR